MKSLLKKEWIMVKNSLFTAIGLYTIISIIMFVGISQSDNEMLSNLLVNSVLFLMIFYFIYLVCISTIFQDFTSYIEKSIFSLPINRKQYMLSRYIIYVLEFVFVSTFLVILFYVLSMITGLNITILPNIFIISFLYSTLCISLFFLPILILPIGSSRNMITLVSIIFNLTPFIFLSKSLKSYVLPMFMSNFNKNSFIFLIIGVLILIASYISSRILIVRKDL